VRGGHTSIPFLPLPLDARLIALSKGKTLAGRSILGFFFFFFFFKSYVHLTQFKLLLEMEARIVEIEGHIELQNVDKA
jgi:hypothetical protein